MANYLRSDLGKKKNQLFYYEDRLLGELRLGNISKVVELVEEVRAAQMAVLKDKRSAIACDGVREIPLYKKIDREATKWQHRSASEIIKIYQSKLPRD